MAGIWMHIIAAIKSRTEHVTFILFVSWHLDAGKWKPSCRISCE
jgi:hypothetical protein